ncbi:MAG: hypothetical protein Ct9H300mP7_1910 [Verrucomicrobiota bacterium]|nr:MAG: hypothetical protein Ct9H300mP7_1910 [Verrucomicrobiota bacterium]
MRKAQFVVKGKDGRGRRRCCSFISDQAQQAGASKCAALAGAIQGTDRQTQGENHDETIDNTKVTYVTAEGTFMKGPPFGGSKVPC